MCSYVELELLNVLTMNTGFSIIFLTAIIGSQWGRIMAGCFDVPIADICNNETDVVPYMSSRDPLATMTNVTLQQKYCDLFAMEKNQWYRSEMTMTTTCPEMYKCGAKFPIWMAGSQPEADEGIVDRAACVRDFDNCCLIRYKLAAVNCGQYLAYCLLDLPSGCPQRYCFDRQTGLRSSGAWTSASWNRNASIYSATTLSSTSETNVPKIYVTEMVLNKELIIILSVAFVFTALAIFVFLIFRRKLKNEDKKESLAKEAPENKFGSQNVSVLGDERADYGLGEKYEMRYTCVGDLSGLKETEYSTLHLYETIPEIDKSNSTPSEYH